MTCRFAPRLIPISEIWGSSSWTKTTSPPQRWKYFTRSWKRRSTLTERPLNNVCSISKLSDNECDVLKTSQTKSWSESVQKAPNIWKRLLSDRLSMVTAEINSKEEMDDADAKQSQWLKNFTAVKRPLLIRLHRLLLLNPQFLRLVIEVHFHRPTKEEC